MSRVYNSSMHVHHTFRRIWRAALLISFSVAPVLTSNTLRGCCHTEAKASSAGILAPQQTPTRAYH